MTIHLTGAAGSGTSTLGQALARSLGVPWFDTDDYYWEPTDPPYQKARPAADRMVRLAPALDDRKGWVLSGSLCGWGDGLIPRFDLVVFLLVDPVLRLARLTARERERYGDRVLAGGDRSEASRVFLDWAARYDTAGPELRSRVLHEAWLAGLRVPVLRLDGAEALAAKVEAVHAALKALPNPRPPESIPATTEAKPSGRPASPPRHGAGG